jgi:hypothetical protein
MINIIKEWHKFINRNKIYSKQKMINRITSSEIVKLFDESNDPIIKVSDLYLTDRTFKLVDINYLKKYLKDNSVSEYKYVKEIHDCDDFSYILQGDITRWDSDLAFGIIHGKTIDGYSHAWNVCIGTDKKVWFIEPQTDEIWTPKVNYKIYLVLM